MPSEMVAIMDVSIEKLYTKSVSLTPLKLLYTDFMKAFLLLAFLFTFSLNFITYAQETTEPAFAECDLCGYCPRNYPTPPGNWAQCIECLYPSARLEPTYKDTLKIEPTTHNPPQAQPGRMYTMIGCIKTDSSGFNQQGAAASVIQAMLDLVFRVVGGIAFLYFMYGAFLVLTSQADPERLNHGKQTLYGAIVGLLFSLLSIFIVRIIATGILRIPGFS